MGYTWKIVMKVKKKLLAIIRWEKNLIIYSIGFIGQILQYIILINEKNRFQNISYNKWFSMIHLQNLMISSQTSSHKNDEITFILCNITNTHFINNNNIIFAIIEN